MSSCFSGDGYLSNFKRVTAVVSRDVGFFLDPIKQSARFRPLLGDRFTGVLELQAVFGKDAIDLSNVPAIPTEFKVLIECAPNNYFLFLMPGTLNGKRLTMTLLRSLVADKLEVHLDLDSDAITNSPPTCSSWVLLTKDPCTEGVYNDPFKHAVDRLGKLYRRSQPNSLELVTMFIIHFLRTGERLFRDDNFRSGENTLSNHSVFVGYNDSSALNVTTIKAIDIPHDHKCFISLNSNSLHTRDLYQLKGIMASYFQDGT